MWAFNTPVVGVGLFMDSWVRSQRTQSTQTTADVDPMKMFFFIKAYTLKRVRGQSPRTQGASRGRGRYFDEKSERHEATLSVDSKDREYMPIDNPDKNSCANASEKV
jgi:hypothetical protein